MAGAEPGGEAELTAAVALATALALSGESGEATLLATRAADRIEAGEPDDLLLAGYAGSALRLVGDHPRARTLLATTVDHARRTGALGLVPYALVRLAGVELETGGWERAEAMAAESLRLARDAGRGADAGLALGLLAWIAAARGDHAGCTDALGEARELAHRLGAGSQFDYAATAEGLLQLGDGNAAAAVADLEHLEAEQAAQGWSDAAARPHIAPDLAEALARSGLTAKAEEVLGRFDEDAARSARASALAAAARARLSLCPEHQVDQILRDAIAHADAAGDPFERARALLCAGDRLVRSGRSAEAESPLAAALHGFAQLGAVPFASQTQAALRAAGLPAPQIRPNPLARLGRDQLAVVVASAEGASISELAERLALGPRTVERLLTDALEVLGLTEVDALGPLLAASPGGCISRTSRGRTAPESSPRRSGAAPRMPESRGAG
jgi:DNA-binding CsgD family transcriptional regulator